ncbi:toxin-activating lysine-acyltransferase [Grimontia marina]|uniref:RTX toxin-activating lysine-acyltransferase n=1 Tax=Grimontia marina TaxID=646534 RepID=A0A128ETC6_9GAMM|nr:toxin-activating lysine-acyltransferase [Grimontia marina]CZF77829.1 RTX toxin acyltransferase family protein [Grimontia marina]
MSDIENKNEASLNAENQEKPSPEVLAAVEEMRTKIRESFGKIAMTMMMLPRYRHQTIADLQHLVLDPLVQNRIALAYPGEKKEDELQDLVGMAIWASVSEEVDAKIRDQIKGGTYPVRLKSEDWNSGEINWLFDVIAPNKDATAKVIRNFKQVVKEGDLKIHPLVAKLVEPSVLEGMGAMPTKRKEKELH